MSFEPPDRDAAEREAARRAREAARAGGGYEEPRPQRPSGPRPVRRRRRALLVVAAVAAVVLLWFLVTLFQPFKGDGGRAVAVTIPKGSGVGEIADLLERRGVVSSGFLFELRATLSGSRGDLKPGSYRLKEDMSYGAAIDALAKGPASNLVNVTIPEGRSRREIAASIAPLGLRGSYLKATTRSPLLDPRRMGGRRARDLEGFLFPSTYQLRRGAPVKTLVDKQLGAFRTQIAKVDMRAARHVNLTTYDVVTIASLVEREAQVPSERPLIASVIYNRLHENIHLGIDATIRFATGNWSSPLTNTQLQTPSPYNTRRNLGLPPGPIGNPGAASLRAAAHPASTRFLYYVVKPDTCGRHAFSTTYAQFLRDNERYKAARAARGGKSPTKC
jgi:peptidoglycan lytic transglycosylase G